MPRKKTPTRFKYTGRKNGDLYVKFPLPGLKYPVWRKCFPETQGQVDKVIADIKKDFDRKTEDREIPDSSEKFFAFWLDSMNARVSTRTLQGYEKTVRLYLTPALSSLPMAEIKPIHIQTLYQSMTARGLEAQTVRKAHTVAGAIFKEAVSLELIASNPVARAHPPKITDSLKTKVMSEVEARRFLVEAEKSKYGIIFEFALETGMRPQEYLALRWSDIDFEKNRASVVRALVYDRKGGGYYYKEPKTRKSKRIVPISARLAEKLLLYKEKQDEYLIELKERLRRRCKPSRESRREYTKRVIENFKSENLAFASQDGTPFKDINLGRRYFKPIAEAAGLDASLSLYALRHSCATLLLAANVNPKIVSERLGHSGINITLSTYSHVLPGMQETATEKLSEMLY